MSLNLPLSHHQRREAMCVHMQVTECSLACHGCAFSAPYHGSYIAVQELLRCSSLSVCEELETKSQPNLSKCPRPVPAAMQGDARLASSQAKHLLQGRGNSDARESSRAGPGSSCFWVLLPPCLPFSNQGASASS